MLGKLKRWHWLGALALFLVLPVILFYGCEDFGLEPDFFKGRIRGEVRIDTPIPKNTDEIRVALSPDFPPSDFRELIIGEVLPLDTSLASQNIPFEIQVPYGRYDATVVTWKEKGRGLSLTDIVGLHGNIERFELASIELNNDNPVEDSVSIGVDLSLVNRTSRVQGTIDFIGEWPSNTFITAFIMLRSIQDLQGIPPVLAFIPSGITSFNINVPVSPAAYNIIGVAWLPTGPFDLGKVRFLGFYENPSSPGQPGRVVVEDSMVVRDLNILADLANTQE